MKNISFLFIFFISFSLQALDVSITYAEFRNNNDSYVECYFHFVGNTLNYLPINEDPTTLQATVEILIFIRAGEEIVAFDKYDLRSPVFSKSSDFQDVKRFILQEGDYNMEVEIVDKSNIESKFSWNSDITISSVMDGQLGISDLQLLASVSEVIEEGDGESEFSKSGFTFEILPYDFLHGRYKQLHIYNEFYNLDQSSEDLFVSYGIKNDFYRNQGKEYNRGFKKLSLDKSITPYLKTMDITELRSGNYHVFVELVNKEKEVLASSYYDFQRSNPQGDFEFDQNTNENFEESFVYNLEEEMLNYYLRAHLPIARRDMISIINSLVRNGSIKSKRYYLYKHWTDVNESHAGALFNKYMEVANALDKMYNSGFGYGFETDRGYIYLRYGRPTQKVEVNDELSAPPYEIWAYDVIQDTGETNVKFIFYNPTLSHNAFDLLHSTCRGERFNPAWETVLYKSAVTEDTRGSIDATTVEDKIGRNARRIFEEL